MAARLDLAEHLEKIQGDSEELWKLHFYGFAAAETAGRRLPGFGGGRPEGSKDLYEALATIRRLQRSQDGLMSPVVNGTAGWVITLLCGLRYHPEMAGVLETIHTYADTDGYSSPDWRVVEPGEELFARNFGPHAVRVDGQVLYARGTGRSSTRIVWRLYRTPQGEGYVDDLVVSTSGGYVPLYSIDRRTSLPDLTTSHVGIMIGGKLHRAS
jgi:hypothetical protein